MTGLVGPDGAGKTTMIRILAGLIEPDEGEVTVLGRPALKADHAQIGYMPQRFGLYEDLTVIENMNLYADLRNLVGPDRTASFDRLLQFTDLKRFEDRLAGKLSGGMKQKLGLACALLKQPKLLLLDEPGVGVDPVSRRELWDMVKDLIGEGVGVLWSTAYLDEAERCRRCLSAARGQTAPCGTAGRTGQASGGARLPRARRPRSAPIPAAQGARPEIGHGRRDPGRLGAPADARRESRTKPFWATWRPRPARSSRGSKMRSSIYWAAARQERARLRAPMLASLIPTNR